MVSYGFTMVYYGLKGFGVSGLLWFNGCPMVFFRHFFGDDHGINHEGLMGFLWVYYGLRWKNYGKQLF